MNLAENIGAAIDYIEQNLDGELDIREIAARSYLSAFYFQRVFGALCGMTVGEYIRSRRLTRAAEELRATDAKVIDVAVKYGYASPDSFARAFARFHGVLPSAAKESGAKLRSFAPLKVKLVLEGGNMIDYRIVHKESFTVVGVSRQFSNETSYDEIPKYWEEYMAQEDRAVMGTFGVCIDTDGTLFDYMIADNYQPWNEIPEGCVAYSFPAGDWAVFPCTMQTLQDTNTKMWKEWLPNCKEYKLGANCNLEVYSGEDYCELWLPVEKA